MQIDLWTQKVKTRRTALLVITVCIIRH